MDEAKGAFSRLHCDCFDELVENAFSYDAEKFADLRGGNFVAGVSAGLLEERKSVAKPAFRSAGENRDGAGINFEIFGLGDALDFAGNFLECEGAEVEKLRSRFDRFDKIFRTGGGENEYDALGRFFESFQQGVRRF